MDRRRTVSEIVQTQSMIISEQSKTINELFQILAQYLTPEELDSLPQVARINTLAGLMD
jgi:predicted HTH domain antitoxin